MQHGAAGSLPPLSVRRPLDSFRLLLGSGRWLLGFFVGLGGWALYVAALRLAPLSLVQAVAAGGLGILALLVWLSPDAPRPGRREQAAVAAAVLGLLLLAVSLAGQAHTAAAPGAGHVAAWLVAVVLASHGLAFVSLQLAFQRGGALVTVGLATLLTNALPIAAGAELFHEGVPSGLLGAVRLVAFALVVAGAALLGAGVPAEPEPASHLRLTAQVLQEQ